MMKIQFCLAIFFLFCVFHGNTQQTYIDRLKQELAIAKTDSAKIDLADKISDAYTNTNLDSLVLYSKQTVDLLKSKLTREKQDSIKLLCLFGISGSYRYVSNDSMLFYAQKAYLFSKKNKNVLPVDAELRALSKLGFSLWLSGNYPDAKETYFKTLKLAEELGDTMLIADAYAKIAMVNRNAGDFRQAITYYTKAENIVNVSSKKQVLLGVLTEKGGSYEQLGILDSAYNCLQEVLAIIYGKYKKDKFNAVHSELGTIYSKMGKKELAEEFFRKSFQLLNSEEKDIRLLARANCQFAEHFDRFNQLDSSIYYASKGLWLDQRFNLLMQQLQASKLLTKLYKQENDIDSAFKYLEIMVNTRDSIFSLEKINRLQTLEFNEQLRQQQLSLEKAKAKEQRKQNIQYALIALGIIIFIILFLLLSRSFITNTRLIEFFGILALLIVFEFLNLLLHPFLEKVTNHTPVLMLVALVCIAAFLIPLHNRVEKWSTAKLVEKNKRIRLANAKKTIEKLEEKN
jgi:hypothetical protein